MAVDEWVRAQRDEIRCADGRQVLDALVQAAEADPRYVLAPSSTGPRDIRYRWNVKPDNQATIVIRLNLTVAPLAYTQQPATTESRQFWSARGMYYSHAGEEGKVVLRLTTAADVAEFFLHSLEPQALAVQARHERI